MPVVSASLNVEALERAMVLAGVSSYRELARRCRIHETTVNHLVRGRRRILPHHVTAFANALGVAMTDLLADPKPVA